MGIIHPDVKEKHLIFYPEQKSILKPFLNGFDITWARLRRAFNTDLSVYFIKPAENIKEAYGFSREIMLVYSNYEIMESRTIQAAELFLNEDPAKGRVENYNYFLVSEDDNIKEWTKTYISQNPESRIIIAFSANELKEKKGDSYYIRTIIDQYLYGRDLFNFRLPLEKDYYFFGRKDIVASIYDSISKIENKGLFGLRKTGKTSLLYKLERQVKAKNAGIFFYYDCKLPSIRKLKWNQLFEKICLDISKRLNIEIENKFDEINIAETFAKLIEKSKEKNKIILVFDEIEYISPKAIDDPHWEKDFINFWQTFWAVQSRQRNVCAIIVGVNPYPLETDVINGIQNPLFGIVSYEYLRGFDYEDMKLMIKTLGKKMGLKFDPNSLKYIHKYYGGHPLLTRIVCSYINQNISMKKPFDITCDYIKKIEDGLDSHLTFYYRHDVSELEQFYKDEYDLLELLVSGQNREFINRSEHPQSTKHLVEYGLLSFDGNNIPTLSIPMISKYIGFEYMRREGRKTIYKLVEPEQRDMWLKNHRKTIISDLRSLEKIIEKKSLPLLFGTNSFPEAEKLCQIGVVTDKASYGNFLNTYYRCFVESIENYGKSLHINHYFWEDIKTAYPALWEALYRLKLYRHASVHSELNEKPHEDFFEFVKMDLEGKNPSEIPDLEFFIQQCILDGILTGIQIESNKYSS